MNWLYILLAITAFLLIYSILKHHFIRSLARFIVLIAILVILFLVVSNYLNSRDLISSDNKLIATGATIVENLKDIKDDLKINPSSNLFDSKNYFDTRKLYK